MNEKLKEDSFGFSIRLMELVKYLEDGGREFPLSQQLLVCGNGILINLSMAEMTEGKERTATINKALAYAVESSHLLKLMAKTGYLTERQSMPLREECESLVHSVVDHKKNSK